MEIINTSTSELTGQSLTLGECAEQSISKFVHKINSFKATVLEDSDPEPLHKMRVGMRRLRSVVQVLEPAIVLPDACSRKAIGKLASVLGAVRDLDIMQENLRAASRLDIPDLERQLLAKVTTALVDCRQKAFVRMETCLAKEYRAFLRAGKKWLDRPQFRNQYIANQLAGDILPDLLLPTISEFFLHDGWSVTDENIKDSQPTLHDLRKITKRIRYQTEFFLPYLNTDANPFLSLLEITQELLGQMQDELVLREFIIANISKKAVNKIPVLSSSIAQKKIKAWSDWQPIKIQLCSQAWRRSLRMACI